MSIKHLLAQRFPYGSTEHHYLPYPTMAVSSEGFAETLKKFFRRKKEKKGSDKTTAPTPEPVGSPWKWLFDELAVKNPNDFTINPGTIVIPTTYAPFFMRGGKPLTDVVAEVQNDLKAYRRLVAQYKPKWVAFDRFIAKAADELEKFQRKDPEAERSDEFYVLVKRIAQRCPPPLVDSFKEPTHKFLGFTNDSFVKISPAYRAFGREYPARKEFVSEPTKDKATQEIEITLTDEKQVHAFLATVKDVLKLSLELDTYTVDETGPILDASEQPFRAYRDRIPDDWDNNIVTFLQPDNYDLHIGLAFCIQERVTALVDALGRAGRKWTEGE